MRKKFYFILLTILMMVSKSVKAQIIDTDPNSSNYGQVVWLGTSWSEAVTKCAAGEYVYLYNVKENKFLNVGGSYGVHASLSSVGMRLKIEQTTYNNQTVYTIAGRLDNVTQGGYMSPLGENSADIYMDRVGYYVSTQTSNNQNSPDYRKFSQPNWQYTQTIGSVSLNGNTETTYTYRIRNYHRSTNQYVGLANDNTNVNFVGNNGNGSQWRIITEKDYENAMDNVTWGEVDLGAFVQDAEFGRDNMDGRYWVWSSNGEGGTPGVATDREGNEYTVDGYVVTGNNIHWHQRNQNVMCNRTTIPRYNDGTENAFAGNAITRATIGTNIANNTSNNYTWDAFRSNFADYYAAEIYREVNSLKQEISMTNVENLTSGLYKLTAQALYYDDAQGLTNDGVSYFVVSVKTGDNVTTERLPIIPMNKISNNIHPHSGVSAGYVFDTQKDAYVLNFFVELTQESKLTIGIETTKAEGWTVIGNVHLYAHGKQVVFLDEDWSEMETLDFTEYGYLKHETGNPYEIIGFYDNDYSYPINVDYQRTFTLNKWNTICLPIPVNGAQVRQAFGSDCILSELQGIDGSVMRFKAVDLDLEGIKAGKPYIIKPTREPDVKEGETVEQTISNGGQNHTATVKGPTYFIPGVDNSSFTYEAGNPKLPDLEKPTGTGDPTVTFEGTFYKKVLTPGTADMNNFDNWVITKGNMYHLTGTKEYTVWATYCYLHAPKSSSGNAKNVRIFVDDDEIMTTAIEGLMIDYGPAINDNDVYTLSGQRMGGADNLNALPKGVYIVNGKKYVVK